MKKVCRKGVDKERYIALFTDCILYATPIPFTNKLKTPHIIYLNNMTIETSNSYATENEITILSTDKSIRISFETKHDTKAWTKDINMLLSATPSEDSEINFAPIWQIDSAHTACGICSSKFTFILRRHHCRICGNLVCSKCLRKKISSHKEVRLCTSCSPAVDRQGEMLRSFEIVSFLICHNI